LIFSFTRDTLRLRDTQPAWLVNHLSHGSVLWQHELAVQCHQRNGGRDRIPRQNVFWHTPPSFSRRCANPNPNQNPTKPKKYALPTHRQQMSAKTM